MTNKAEGVILCHSPPGIYSQKKGGKMNGAAWLVMHLGLCLLIGGCLHH